MTYQPTKPQPNDDLDVSVTDIKNNFLVANTVMGIDHVPFDDVTANKGFHKVVHIVNNGGNPAPVTGAGELFTKIVNSNGFDTALFYQTAFGQLMQLTVNIAPIPGTTGSTFLPGNLIFQWGQGTTNSSGNGSISFVPNFLTFYSASLTRIETGGNNRGYIQFTSLPNASSGTVKMRDDGGTGIAGSFLWTAIGTL